MTESKGKGAMPKYEFVAIDFVRTLFSVPFPEVGEPKDLVLDYVY